eukprot:NODE_156_length_15158_cov_0.791553.p5 type:complete len:392 gc:universal NODE_156_length_15158_cov_0.791553:271-1446(+)
MLQNESLKKILSQLSNPQNNLKIIHIAGTNGKGTTGYIMNKILIEMLNQAISEKSNCVGWFHSPAILPDHDILINLKPVSNDVVAAAVMEYSEYQFSLSPFEFRVLLAIVIFKELKCDYCIFECGLGGLNDATNIFFEKEIAIITQIGLDHQDQLGNTLTDIATHKLGIIKNSKHVFTTKVQNQEVLKLFAQYPHIQEIPAATLIGFNKYEYMWSYKNIEIKSKILGHHQGINIALALEAIFLLIGSEIRSFQIEKAWPGRLQYIKYKDRELLLDGAHNIDSILALRKYLDLVKFGNCSFIFSCTGNKDIENLIDTLIKNQDQIILFQFEIPKHSPWIKLPSNENYGKYRNLQTCSVLDEAIELCKHNIVICGSLYMVYDCLLKTNAGPFF